MPARYRRNIPTIQRQPRPSMADLGSRPAGRHEIDTWLRNIAQAPDATTAQRNAAAIEHRYLGLYDAAA